MSGGTPMPGGYGLAVIQGKLGGLVAAGQAWSGDGSIWTHAFLVLDKDRIIEGEPGGAKIRPLSRYLERADVRFVDPIALLHLPDPDRLRQQVCRAGERLEGTPYSYLDYLALTAVKLRLPSDRMRRRVANSGHMICSQVVDTALRRGGVHLWVDGRQPGDCTPGDLGNWPDTLGD